MNLSKEIFSIECVSIVPLKIKKELENFINAHSSNPL